MSNSRDNLNYYNGLSALLEEDLSAFEYFNTLPEDVKRRAEAEDINSFDDLQEYAEKLMAEHAGNYPSEEYPLP